MPDPSITDHRARPIELYGLLSDRVRVINREAVPIDVQKEIEREVNLPGNPYGRTQRRWNVALAVITFAGTGVAARIVTGINVPRLQAIILTAIALVLAVLVTMPLRRAHIHRRYAAAIVDAFLARRRCPACGYDLAGLGPDADDGCVVCPECGAAWRLGRKHLDPRPAGVPEQRT